MQRRSSYEWDDLTHPLKMEDIFVVILLTRAVVKDVKDAHTTADRSGKADHTSQPTISSSMKRTCNTCAVFVVKNKVSDSVPRLGRGYIYISGWCGL